VYRHSDGVWVVQPFFGSYIPYYTTISPVPISSVNPKRCLPVFTFISCISCYCNVNLADHCYFSATTISPTTTLHENMVANHGETTSRWFKRQWNTQLQFVIPSTFVSSELAPSVCLLTDNFTVAMAASHSCFVSPIRQAYTLIPTSCNIRKQGYSIKWKNPRNYR
jgi:hypothetical protein